MELHFTKMQGAGNDFIIVDGFHTPLSLSKDQIAYLCDRHFGIGADGLIIVEKPSNDSHAGFMNYYNSDGTIAEMCGNGIRCFAAFMQDKGYLKHPLDTYSIETRAGIKYVTFLQPKDSTHLLRVNMGSPYFAPKDIPTTLKTTATTPEGEPFIKDALVDSPYGKFHFSCISMGNPHAVTFIEDIDSLDIDTVGAYFESCELFPQKANIEFATIIDDTHIKMRVFERGCGETLACGTGACAVNVAAYCTGRASRNNVIELLGGSLKIEYDKEGIVYMTGEAQTTFTGSLYI